MRGTPRQGFEPERTAAGEQVEHARLFDARLQPVEQGFPHTVGCRADLDAGRELQSPPPMSPGDDAQDARARTCFTCTTACVMGARDGATFSAVSWFWQRCWVRGDGLPPFGAQAYATVPIRQARRIV